MTTTRAEYANWDMSTYFDAFDSEQYRAYRNGYKQNITVVLQRARALGGLTPETLSEWVTLLLDAEQLMVQGRHLFSYLGCLSAADSKNESYNSEYAGLQALSAQHQKVSVRVLAAFKGAEDAVFDQLVSHPDLASASYKLHRMRTESQKKMDPELEALAAELSVDGLNAWSRLYDQVAGRLEFEMPQPDGPTKSVPMALRNSLLESPDAEVRQAALAESNQAWAGVEEVTAASLNAIAGTRLTLYERRGIDDFLEPALFGSGITRKTLDALLGAIEERCGVARSYLQRKAELLGSTTLGFQDVYSPLPLDGVEKLDWQDATERVVSAFDSFYPALGEFAQMTIDKRWIDSEVREGKRPGGFCTTSYHNRESRIFMSFNNTLGDVQTLAHELGHAFHSWLMRDMRPWQRGYPMTLAETASIFAETLFTDALLSDSGASERDKAIVLTTRMDNACAFLLNIPMRFYFERDFYRERAEGVVRVSRLKELMLAAQARCFGDCLDPEQMDPYFWASKLHFYISGVSFYNYPYSFGYLFSLGVAAMAKQQGPEFLPRYEQLLRLTGSDTAENVARRALGVDIQSQEFWESSIALIEADFEQWEAVLPGAL